MLDYIVLGVKFDNTTERILVLMSEIEVMHLFVGNTGTVFRSKDRPLADEPHGANYSMISLTTWIGII